MKNVLIKSGAIKETVVVVEWDKATEWVQDYIDFPARKKWRATSVVAFKEFVLLQGRFVRGIPL